MQRNYVELAGFLGADPDIRTVANGDIRATFSFATTERWGRGPESQRTEWHRIVAWGATASFVEKHLKKGTHVFIEGQLRTRIFERNGERRTRTEVHVLPAGIEFLRPPQREGVPANSPTSPPTGDIVLPSLEELSR